MEDFMELNTLLTELLADNSGRIGADIEGRTKPHFSMALLKSLITLLSF